MNIEEATTSTNKTDCEFEHISSQTLNQSDCDKNSTATITANAEKFPQQTSPKATEEIMTFQSFGRWQLLKMPIERLQEIHRKLHEEVEFINARLVSSLMEKDVLYMQKDALIVEIEDLRRFNEGTANISEFIEKSSA